MSYTKNGEALGGGGGMANPMTASGNMIIGGVAGAPAQLATGSGGNVLRTIDGVPAWHALSSGGLLATREAAVEAREGQTFWATDAVVGEELSTCTHQGGTTYTWETLAYGVGNANAEKMIGATAGVTGSLDLHSPPVDSYIESATMSGIGPGGALGTLTYAGSPAFTLTSDQNINISGLIPFGASILFYFSSVGTSSSGVYTVTDVGANGGGGHPPVFTRRSDFDASADFADGAAVLTTGAGGGSVALYAFSTGGGFVLDSDPIRVARVGIGAVTATGADAAAARTSIAVYSSSETDAAITTTVGGLLYKGTCRAVSTSPIASLAGYPTIDGVTVSSGDTNKRVLLSAQSDAKQNGPWITSSTAWSRPTVNELQACAAFPIEGGTANHDTVWYLTTNDPITPGGTDVSIEKLTLNIPATQITDSTTAGRALLTAANAAAQLAALGLGGTSTLSSFIVPLAGYSTSTGPATAAAWVTFNPALYAISGKTTVITLETTGSVSTGGSTGTATLKTLPDNTTVATISIAATTPTVQTIGVTLPLVTTVYELNLSLSGSGYVASGAILRLTWI